MLLHEHVLCPIHVHIHQGNCKPKTGNQDESTTIAPTLSALAWHSTIQRAVPEGQTCWSGCRAPHLTLVTAPRGHRHLGFTPSVRGANASASSTTLPTWPAAATTHLSNSVARCRRLATEAACNPGSFGPLIPPRGLLARVEENNLLSRFVTRTGTKGYFIIFLIHLVMLNYFSLFFSYFSEFSSIWVI
jgi:hypothetical protein